MADQIRIYTDGACRGNPGPGGWGAVLMHGDKIKKLYGGEPETTNNRMELTAVIKALECIKSNKWPLEITSDSKYVLQGITEWIEGWKRKGWRNASKKPVMNVDLWQRLDELVQPFEITWHWVKGHSGHPENEMADQLANQGIDEL
ncbi:ribonuclease HI [Gammaproteobacteria bacterium]|nr:ribonuclease HI [Gammaproteobacteria bacterium]